MTLAIDVGLWESPVNVIWGKIFSAGRIRSIRVREALSTTDTGRVLGLAEMVDPHCAHISPFCFPTD